VLNIRAHRANNQIEDVDQSRITLDGCTAYINASHSTCPGFSCLYGRPWSSRRSARYRKPTLGCTQNCHSAQYPSADTAIPLIFLSTVRPQLNGPYVTRFLFLTIDPLLGVLWVAPSSVSSRSNCSNFQPFHAVLQCSHIKRRSIPGKLFVHLICARSAHIPSLKSIASSHSKRALSPRDAERMRNATPPSPSLQPALTRKRKHTRERLMEDRRCALIISLPSSFPFLPFLSQPLPIKDL
jgi:hypothetical protein